MSDGKAYVSNATISQIADRLRQSRRVVVTTHQKPDGDAVGSALAAVRALTSLGIEAQLWLLPPVGEVFMKVIGDTPCHLAGGRHLPPADADLILVTDTGARSQLADLAVYLAERHERVCIIDHHIQGDATISPCRVVRPEAAAASEIVAELVETLGVRLTPEIATPLYLGVATDTGWFRFSNTSPRAFRTAAKMLDAGVDHPRLYRLIEQTDRPERLRLLARALGSLELHNNGRVAVLSLRAEDFEETGAGPDDTHGFSDSPHCVGTVEVVALLSETERGTVKISLRSKQSADPVDVNAIAGQFGGGGHARASGAKMKGTIPEVKTAVLARLSGL